MQVLVPNCSSSHCCDALSATCVAPSFGLTYWNQVQLCLQTIQKHQEVALMAPFATNCIDCLIAMSGCILFSALSWRSRDMKQRKCLMLRVTQVVWLGTCIGTAKRAGYFPWLNATSPWLAKQLIWHFQLLIWWLAPFCLYTKADKLSYN